MLRFITYLQITPQLKRQIKFVTIGVTGLLLGYWKGKVVNKKYQNINQQKLTQYETQDQINMLIQKQQKPAVIYYGLAIYKDHSFYRQMMMKYSNKYPQNAIWTMVNVQQKFQQIKNTFDYKYITRTMLQVRHPKSQIAIKLGDQGQFMQLKEKGHRRQGYKYNTSQQGFKKFLQQNRIIEGKDPIKSVLKITRNALFANLDQNNYTNMQKSS